MIAPDLILRSLGWRPRRAPRTGPGTPALTPIAERAGSTAYLHQTPIGAPFPDYAGRRALRCSLGARGESAVIIFADLLRTAQVWQWREHAPQRPSATREASLFAGDDVAPRLAHLTRIPATAPPPLPGLEPAGVDAAAAAIIPTLRRRARTLARTPAATRRAERPRATAAESTSAELREEMQHEIEECADPGWLGALWPALAGRARPRGEVGLAVLGCGTAGGAMLLAALEVLEPISIACLERMRAWVDDARLAREAPRGRLADFRALLERAADVERWPTVAHFARSRLLRDTLYGALPEAAAREGCRTALRAACTSLDAWAGARGAWPEPNLCVGMMEDQRMGIRGRALPEALEVAGRAELLLRALEEAPGAGWAELARAREALRARWAAEAGGGVDAAFPHIARRGGFDVVLGAGTAAPLRPRRGPGVHESIARYSPSHPDPERAMQSDALLHLSPTDYAYPARLGRRLGDQAPAVLTVRGSVTPLGRPLLALFCSQRVPGSIVLKGFDLARRLCDLAVPVVGGFHSALEREWLDMLLKGSAPVLLCPARTIEPIRRMPRALRAPLAEERLSIISGFAPTQRRASRSFALARNRLVAALAERVFIAHADPGGTLFLLAKEVMEWGVPVYTFDDPRNADLLLLGARALATTALGAQLIEVAAE